MKCPRCGAEVEAKRFCIFCGENLQSRENLQVRRASSGVMRIRHRSSISQTALPEVQKRSTDNQQRINLASLNGKKQFDTGASSFEEMSKPVIPAVSAKESQEESRSDKRSRELEALLGSLSSSSFRKLDSAEFDVSDELRGMDEVNEAPRKVQSMNSFDINLNEEEDEGFSFDDEDLNGTNSLSEAFFDKETSSMTDLSETLPVGSGTFARVPSNVFHPIWESIKSACEGMVQRIQSLRKKPEGSSNTTVTSDKQKKLTRIALLSIIAVALLAIVIVSMSGNDEPEMTAASQTTAPAPGSEPFDIIAQDGDSQASDEFVFDADDDFSIPALENDEELVAQNDADDVQKEKVQNNARLTELRLYGKKDNVLSVLKPGETYQSKNTCVVREGPASRFGLVKQVSPKTKMLILADVEEDWVLETGGVWTKAGETPRLGPGKEFANAVKGMSIPQPKSRVISAKKWKYVQVGDLYGYVGPACFK